MKPTFPIRAGLLLLMAWLAGAAHAQTPATQPQSLVEQARSARDAGKFGQAYTLFMSAAQSLSGDEAASAKNAADAVAQDAKDKMQVAEQAITAGNQHLAVRLLDAVRKAYEGSPMGDQATARLKDLAQSSAAAATEPSAAAATAPAVVLSPVDEAAEQVARVQAQVLARLYASADYKAADAEVRTSFEKVTEARKGQDVQARLDASGEYNRARAKLDGLVAAALQDPQLAAAQLAQRTAEVDAAPKHAAPPAAAPTGNVVDLLRMVDPDKDAVAGHWSVADGALSSDASDAARVCFPYEPPEEYDLHVEFTRVTGADIDTVNLLLCTPSSELAFGANMSTGAFWDAGGGLNDATAFPFAFHNGTKYSFVVQVRKAELTAFLDGKQVSHFSGDPSTYKLNHDWNLGPHRLGLGTWEASTTFNVIELTEISGHGKALRH